MRKGLWIAIRGLALAIVSAAPGGASAEDADPTPAPRSAAPFEVIAHRGASADAPENTLAAFTTARAQGALHLELDLWLSRDGEVVVFHDAHLKEKTGHDAAVVETDLATLRALDLAPWFRATRPPAHAGVALDTRAAGTGAGNTHIASLDAVFRRFGADPVYHLELKSRDPRLARAVVDTIDVAGLERRVWITSFHLDALRAVRRISELPRCWLLGQMEDAVSEDSLGRAVAEGIERVAVAAQQLDRAIVSAAAARGVAVRAYKVEDLGRLEAVARAGAVGATVDWPGAALERMRALAIPVQ